MRKTSPIVLPKSHFCGRFPGTIQRLQDSNDALALDETEDDVVNDVRDGESTETLRPSSASNHRAGSPKFPGHAVFVENIALTDPVTGANVPESSESTFVDENLHLPAPANPAGSPNFASETDLDFPEGDSLIDNNAEGSSNPIVLPTFFSCSSSFVNVTLDKFGHINTLQFLKACEGITAILDLMGGRAFSPVKADINNNIIKITKHHEGNPDTTATLQKLVIREIELKIHNTADSATDALLWLKRGLEFMSLFLEELLNSEKETRECAHKAYSQTLEKYHNFVVRKIFQVALYAVPYRADLIAAFAVEKAHAVQPDFTNVLIIHAKHYSNALKNILVTLNDFYSSQRL